MVPAYEGQGGETCSNKKRECEDALSEFGFFFELKGFWGLADTANQTTEPDLWKKQFWEIQHLSRSSLVPGCFVLRRSQRDDAGEERGFCRLGRVMAVCAF